VDELTAVTGVGGSLDRRCGGRDSSPAAGERDEACVPPEFPGGSARVRAFQRQGLWRRGHLEIALFLVGLGRIQQAYVSGHVLKIHENNKKSWRFTYPTGLNELQCVI